MDLRTIKQEIHGLSPIKDDLTEFKNAWIKPYKKGMRSHYSHKVLRQLKKSDQKKVFSKLGDAHKLMREMESYDTNMERLRSIGSAVTEMKLINFRTQNGGYSNESKLNFLTNKLLKDDFLSLNNTIKHTKDFDKKLNHLNEIYEEINGFLHQSLNLDHSVSLMEKPHKKYLDSLKLKSHKQKEITRHLGRHFITIQNKLKQRKKT